jgi:tetratricopeptide (TPR) repeat protein
MRTVWSLSDGQETLAYRPESGTARITMLDAPMGALLLIVDLDGHLSLHRAEAARLSSMDVSGIGAPLQDGLIPVFSSYPAPSRLWDIATRHAVRDLPGPVMAQDYSTGHILTRLGNDLAITHLDRANPVRLAANAPRIVASTFGANRRLAIQTPESVLILDTDTGKQLGAWDAVIDQTRAERSAVFSPNGARFFLLAGHDLLLDIDVESSTIQREITLPTRAESIKVNATGVVAIIETSDPKASLRYEFETGALSPLKPYGDMIGGGAHTTIIGDGPEITIIETAKGSVRFTRQGRGEAYAAGEADKLILSHHTGDAALDEPDMLEALNAATSKPLWRIGGRRPFGASWSKPALSRNERWAFATNLGPRAGYLLDASGGRVVAALPRAAQSIGTLSVSDDLSTTTLYDYERADAYDLSAAQAAPMQLIAMLRARVRSAPVADESITDCDRAAAHPDDPLAIAPGRAVEDIPLDAAALCQQALAAIPTGPAAARLTYQLSRALDAVGQSDEAIIMLERLAARDYPMADHALGLWRLGGVGGGPEDAAKHFRRAANGGVGAAWIILARMAEAKMIEGDAATILQAGADAGAPDALEAFALKDTAAGHLQRAYKNAERAALAAAPHRRYRFEALAVTLARRLRAHEGAHQ